MSIIEYTNFFYNPSRFDQSTKEDILAFILGSAQRLSDYGKVCSLSFFCIFACPFFPCM
jgi:hypothetical protein